MPKVSIIVPFYQAERTLSSTVRSVVDQDFIDWELILIDDGSMDSGAKIAEDWKEKDSRIVFLKEPNRGRSVARNLGIMHSKGDWIAFLDADDRLTKKALSILMGGAMGAGLVCGGYEPTSVDYSACDIASISPVDFIRLIVIPEEREKSKRTSLDGLFERTIWGKLYRSDIIKKHGIKFEPQLELGEDALFNIQYVKHIEYISIMNDTTYLYNRTNEGTVRCYKKDQVWDLIASIRSCSKEFGDLVSRGIITDDDAIAYYSKQFKDLFIRIVDYEGDYAQAGMDLRPVLEDPIISNALKKYRGQTWFATVSFRVYGLLIKCGKGKYALRAERVFQAIYKAIRF